MRLTRVVAEGVGGLPDLDLTLPSTPLAAFAGSNGTGKSKLLACLISPWTGVIPPPRQAGTASVTVYIRVTAPERASLEELSLQVGWGSTSIPEEFAVITRTHPLAGTTSTSVPEGVVVISNFGRQPQFLKACPSLDILYLPAERRLVDSSSPGIDLNQLSEDLAIQVAVNARNAVQGYGRLDDDEFERFAKALYVAGRLEEDAEDDTPVARARISWEEFSSTVNDLIYPKRLLPLTRQRPDTLLIQTPEGSRHAVQDLSSGERQALIIISRVMRTGTGRTAALIDEPDAYLHPTLSRRLALALESAVGEDGQLVVATHSPAVLDSIAPSAIIRLSHNESPRPVSDEAERLDVYREAGFRASALTQADLLVVSEGDTEETLLPLLLPELSRAKIRGSGGRSPALADVKRLLPLDLPVIGIIDNDVMPDPISPEISDSVIVWDVADIEAVFLADDLALQVMVDRGLNKEGCSVIELRAILDRLLRQAKDNTVAEIAQRILRRQANLTWPTPRGNCPRERLRSAVSDMTSLSENNVTEALGKAEALWDASQDNRWQLVRGKYVLAAFARECSVISSGPALLEAIARARPALTRLQPLAQKVQVLFSL